jgi:glycosyltransferase involved in cell wall biosynthesis
MSSPARIRAAAETEISAPAVEIVVPVRDEARMLTASVRRLHGYLSASFPFSFRVTIADNGSSDGTWEIAQRLADELASVESVRSDLPGRGRALSTVRSHGDAAVLSYMDVGLSTDLAALLPLVAP